MTEVRPTAEALLDAAICLDDEHARLKESVCISTPKNARTPGWLPVESWAETSQGRRTEQGRQAARIIGRAAAADGDAVTQVAKMALAFHLMQLGCCVEIYEAMLSVGCRPSLGVDVAQRAEACTQGLGVMLVVRPVWSGRHAWHEPDTDAEECVEIELQPDPHHWQLLAMRFGPQIAPCWAPTPSRPCKS